MPLARQRRFGRRGRTPRLTNRRRLPGLAQVENCFADRLTFGPIEDLSSRGQKAGLHNYGSGLDKAPIMGFAGTVALVSGAGATPDDHA
jgi:hypothetical protein